MKANEIINIDMQISELNKLQFAKNFPSEPDSGSGTSSGGTTDPDVPLPPKK